MILILNFRCSNKFNKDVIYKKAKEQLDLSMINKA